MERVPAAYLTREAWLGGQRFYVDERVIIPRSYFVEIIAQQLDAWLRAPEKVRRVVDVCTGSGCLAILLAQHFPQAKVDALDLSADALEVAKINIAAHGLTKRVKLWASDVFDGVPEVKGRKYDVILSNPPYEPSAHVDAQAPEFAAEPRMAHDGGRDGGDHSEAPAASAHAADQRRARADRGRRAVRGDGQGVCRVGAPLAAHGRWRGLRVRDPRGATGEVARVRSEGVAR